MANGPSKPPGLVRCLTNFMGLEVLSFIAIVCVLQSQSFHTAVLESQLFARLRKSQSLNFFFCLYK